MARSPIFIEFIVEGIIKLITSIFQQEKNVENTKSRDNENCFISKLFIAFEPERLVGP